MDVSYISENPNEYLSLYDVFSEHYHIVNPETFYVTSNVSDARNPYNDINDSIIPERGTHPTWNLPSTIGSDATGHYHEIQD